MDSLFGVPKQRKEKQYSLYSEKLELCEQERDLFLLEIYQANDG